MSVEKVKLISDEGSPGNIPERSVKHNDIIKSGRKIHFSPQGCEETAFLLN